MLAAVAKQSSLLQLAALRRAAPSLYKRGFAAGTSNVQELLTDEDYQKALKDLTATKSSAVIDFTAKWCGPCKMIAPVYEKLSKEHPDVRFYKIDIDNADLRMALVENAIASVPTFVFFQGENRVGVFSGANQAQLKDLVKQLCRAHL